MMHNDCGPQRVPGEVAWPLATRWVGRAPWDAGVV